MGVTRREEEAEAEEEEEQEEEPNRNEVCHSSFPRKDRLWFQRKENLKPQYRPSLQGLA